MTFILAVLTFIAFVSLQAADRIDWSGWQVTAPLWLWGLAALIVALEAAFWRAVKERAGK